LYQQSLLKFGFMAWKHLLSLATFVGYVYASTAASPHPTVTADVVVIGGGSAETYTAIRLQQLGKSVFVIEKEDVLGGHTNTFHVPGTNTTFDYGVIQFSNISVVNDYFADLGVALGPYGGVARPSTPSSTAATPTLRPRYPPPSRGATRRRSASR
jgi:phytoene dehydrogenase-like protein